MNLRIFLALFIILKLQLVCAQNDPDKRKAIEDLFARPDNKDPFKDLEEVPTTPSGSISALEKCGEGVRLGRSRCVPYHQCDPLTNTIFNDTEEVVKNTNGFGLIDIRY